MQLANFQNQQLQSKEVEKLQQTIEQLKVNQRAEIVQLTYKEMIQMESTMLRIQQEFSKKNNQIEVLQTINQQYAQQIEEYRKKEDLLIKDHQRLQEIYDRLHVSNFAETVYSIEESKNTINRLHDDQLRSKVLLQQGQQTEIEIQSLRNRSNVIEAETAQQKAIISQIVTTLQCSNDPTSILQSIMQNKQQIREFQQIINQMNAQLLKIRYEGQADTIKLIQNQAQVIMLQQSQLSESEQRLNESNSQVQALQQETAINQSLVQQQNQIVQKAQQEVQKARQELDQMRSSQLALSQKQQQVEVVE